MDAHKLTEDLARVEQELSHGDAEQAVVRLTRLAEDAEQYIDTHYQTTENIQYFAFPSVFELLAYRRVERDPREIVLVDEPLDRLYTDLGFALVCTAQYGEAKEALKQAIRWNPMNCGARLDLAELYLLDQDINEWLALSFSVFARAADPRHLVRAYTNFAQHYERQKALEVASALVVCADHFKVEDHHLIEVKKRLELSEYPPSKMSAVHAHALVEAEGIPDGANAEIAVCLLMCATDVAAKGNKKLAEAFITKAHALVGAPACEALLSLIQEDDGQGETGKAKSRENKAGKAGKQATSKTPPKAPKTSKASPKISQNKRSKKDTQNKDAS